MPAERTCPQCGTPLSPGALEGLCPRCVGRAAFDDASAISPAAEPGLDDLSVEALEAEMARLKPEEAGDRIGPYKLLQQIGVGGFGTVWMAEQERPVQRRVALKIIKLGMDTKEVIARFEQERQALAMMDHPNIAKVFDAGVTQFGRPFFVMELVRGIKITDYCDQANLPTAERLALFIQTCHAVQHAHQKGIIHRDLKPSNILVTLHDGVPVPKVIDFGVAKATQSVRLTDLTLFTQFEQMIGTPLYMSPEQAEMSGLDIDTRSDIYSLGVLLYELLTGRTPFDPEELMQKGCDEIRRTIREQEPQTPSMYLKTMADDVRAAIAQHRQSDPVALTRLVRGDLDWIVMKALEKDRTRRYETATGLARDIERHLADEPVVARPVSQLYRFRRFVKRNKLAFVAGLAIAAALVAGTGVSIWQAVIARRETDRARSAEKAATQNLWQSYLESARASIGTHKAGRRFLALEAVQKAAKIRPAPELRDVAASALMLADLQRTNHRPRDFEHEHNEEWVDLSGDFKSYVRLQVAGHATLCRATDDAILGSLDFPSGAERWPWLSRDSQLLAVLGKDHVLRIRRWSDGTTVLEVPGAHDAAWRPGGERIAISGQDSIDEYSLTSGTRTGSWSCPVGYKITYSSDGSRLAAIVRAGREIQILDTASGAVLQHLPGSNCDALAWHPKQAILAMSGNPQRVAIFNADTGKLLNDWISVGGYVTALVFSLDGGSLLTGGWDSHVRVWNWRTAEPLVAERSGGTGELRLSDDGRQVATRDIETVESSIYDFVSPEATQTLAQEPHVTGHSGVFDPRGRWLAVCEDDVLHLWTADGQRQVARLDETLLGRVHPHGAAFHPEKPELCVATCAGLMVFPLLEKPDGTCEFGPPRRIVEGSHCGYVCYSRDGSLAAAVANAGCQVFETETWVTRMRVGSAGDQWRLPDFSPDGRWVADSTWSRKQTFVWATQDGTEIFRSRDCGNWAGPSFAPEGSTLFAARDGLHAYDTKSWQPSARPLPESLVNPPPSSLVFSRDGTLICTSVYDRVRLARWPSCEPVLDFNCMPDPRITDLAISPDNERLLVVGALGRVELVDLGRLKKELAKLGLGW